MSNNEESGEFEQVAFKATMPYKGSTREELLENTVEESTDEKIPDKVSEEPASQEVPKKASFEDKALATGRWKPKDQFEGDPDDWRPAKEWLERGELLEHIHELKRQTKEQKEALDYVMEGTKKIEEQTRANVLAELEAKQARAAEVGDVQGVKEATKELLEAYKAPAPSTPAVEIAPEVKEFTHRNASWFNNNTPENSAMMHYVIAREKEINAAAPSLHVKDVITLIESEVRSKFPEKFVSHIPSSPVAAPTAKHATKGEKVDLRTLPPFHRARIQSLLRIDKNYDVSKYLKLIKE